MCGFAGFLASHGLPDDDAARTVTRMRDRLVHRGPDDAGIWCDGERGIAFGFRRLSIIDLSPAGHQPMVSHDGRYVMMYNGETYNFAELRAQLEREVAVEWRGHSDTEVILEGFAHWGVAATLERINGMFAIALWDCETRTLWLARDRFGEKPMYYGSAGDSFVFGSELKSLEAHPGWRGEIDRDVLDLYMRYRYVPTPFSIYRNVYKLPAASFAEIRMREGLREVSVEPYWSVLETAQRARANRFEGSLEDAATELEHILGDAVARRMYADVPVGAFLSGGIDSSLTVALMQRHSSGPVHTYSIGFSNREYDESRFAAQVAQKLGTKHQELFAGTAEALAVVPTLPQMYDEPFADSSQIATALVSSLTRQHVTVALSGDAGDEVFGGYNRYVVASRIWPRVSGIPYGARSMVGAAIEATPRAAWSTLVPAIGRVIPSLAVSLPGGAIPKLGNVLRARDAHDMYLRLVTDRAGHGIVIGAHDPVVTDHWNALDGATPPERMMYSDLMTYLTDDILVKVDRASMAASLETRVPFLDPAVVEYAWRLPLAYKVSGGKGKVILRTLLERFVPHAMIDRPKQGFAVPIGAWLRTDLRAWAEPLVAPDRIRSDGWLDAKRVEALWRANQSGDDAGEHTLWSVLMFQAWLEAHKA